MKKPSRPSKPAGFPRISDAELLVMRVLWSKSSSTANAVVDHRASLNFLDRFFGGAVAPFLACFLEREKLAPEQIAGLRRLLNELNR